MTTDDCPPSGIPRPTLNYLTEITPDAFDQLDQWRVEAVRHYGTTGEATPLIRVVGALMHILDSRSGRGVVSFSADTGLVSVDRTVTTTSTIGNRDGLVTWW